MLTEWMKTGTWFGFVEVEISEPLWLKFEIPLFFFTKQIPDEAVPLRHMKDHLQCRGRERGDGRGVVSAKAVAVCPLIVLLCGTWS